VKNQWHYILELVEEADSVNFYTIRIEGEKNTEFEKFLSTYMNNMEFERDLQIITRWMDRIGEKGALERYFRPEGKMRDHLSAIPIEVSKLRLYCLRISDHIVILGNGGFKPGNQRTYNTDKQLNACVEVLTEVDECIKIEVNRKTITINGKIISGNLSLKPRRNIKKTTEK